MHDNKETMLCLGYNAGHRSCYRTIVHHRLVPPSKVMWKKILIESHLAQVHIQIGELLYNVRLAVADCLVLLGRDICNHCQ